MRMEIHGTISRPQGTQLTVAASKRSVGVGEPETMAELSMVRPSILMDVLSQLSENVPLPLEINGQCLRASKIASIPAMFYFDQLVGSEEIAHLLTQGQATHSDKDRPSSPASDVRWFLKRSDPVIAKIERRLELIIGVDTRLLEPIQIRRYMEGDSVGLHYDFYPKDTTYGQYHLARAGQRLWTWLIYLTGVEDGLSGGETTFPALNLEVQPRRGSALLWRNVTEAEGNPIFESLHGSKPAQGGDRIVMTSWSREREVAP